MTPEERQMLTDLATKIAQAPAPQRDPEADELIRTKIGARPDALYVLAQTVLIQNLALDHARQQIQDLQQRPAQPAAAQPNFLGSNPAPGYNAPPPPSPAPGLFGGGGSSFLRSAATTAAGVAAGALAFEGIRSLFGGIAGFGSGPHFGSFLGQAPGAETVINNYYDSPDSSDQLASDDRSDDTADASDSLDDTDVSQADDSADYSDDSGDDGSSGDDLV
ncbi:MAG TPA: DUF2076 family protein [Bryobacteraceae bacterium]|nr:DUF2076 family protein [Bryobacteraceae bacterium]